jgi:superoxide dismutase, Fe-Mn family
MNSTMNAAMELALSANFGSAAGWRTDVLKLMRCDPTKPIAPAVAVQLVFHPDQGSLSHQCLPQRAGSATSQTPGTVTLLTLAIDPRSSEDDPLDGVDWTVVYGLYQNAVHDASAAFGADQDELGTAVLLDVRRAGMFDKAQTMLPNAQWRDPALVSHWAQSLPHDQPVIVYCIYGHEVGRSTALRLRAAGVNARFLSGGIDAWQTAGLPLVDKPPVQGATP